MSLISIFDSKSYDIMLFLRDQKRPLLFSEIKKSSKMIRQTFAYHMRNLRENNLIEQRHSEGSVIGYILSLRAHEILDSFEKSIITYMEIPNSKSLLR